MLQDEESVGYADGALEEASARCHVGWGMFGDEAGEGGFELAAGIYRMAIMVREWEVEGCGEAGYSPRRAGSASFLKYRGGMFAGVLVMGCCSGHFRVDWRGFLTRTRGGDLFARCFVGGVTKMCCEAGPSGLWKHAILVKVVMRMTRIHASAGNKDEVNSNPICPMRIAIR